MGTVKVPCAPGVRETAEKTVVGRKWSEWGRVLFGRLHGLIGVVRYVGYPFYLALHNRSQTSVQINPKSKNPFQKCTKSKWVETGVSSLRPLI